MAHEHENLGFILDTHVINTLKTHCLFRLSEQTCMLEYVELITKIYGQHIGKSSTLEGRRMVHITSIYVVSYNTI